MSYIGIDLGGTSTRIGLFETPEAGTTFTQLARFATQPKYEQQLALLIHAMQALPQSDLAGIGISVGGRMSRDGRSVLVAPNLPDYVGQPFAEELEQRFGCPVRLAHDTVCGLLAEQRYGVLQTCERSAYLTLSTGTGAAIQLGKGENRLTVSIEIGHQLLDGNPLLCLCGQTGCLETMTGGRQLALRLGHPIEQSSDASFWERFVAKLALGLINLTQLTRVEVVAVSGAISLRNAFLLPLLQQKVDELLRGSSLELRPALLGEQAPLVGAVVLLATAEASILH